MELAKQGSVPPDRETAKPVPNKYRALRNGFLCIGIALGIIVSIIVCYSVDFEDFGWDLMVVAGSVLLFTGIAYLAFYVMVKDKQDIDSEIE